LVPNDKELHDKLKDFPPCPENIKINKKWLSPYQLEVAETNNITFDKNGLSSGCKLVPHLMDKLKYCIHYRNLKYVLELGYTLGTVHNIISFKQKPWLKQYIDFNTEKRKGAKNEFEKNLN
jgi:hypothetical protein